MSDEEKDIPIYGPILKIGLYDPIDAPDPLCWSPANEEAAELSAALEACKQVLELSGLVVPDKECSRVYTLLATPVFSLAEHTLRLHALLGQLYRSNWPPTDQRLFVVLRRELKKMVKGPLKKHRDKRSAHHDPDGFHPHAELPSIQPQLVLEPLGHCLALLILSLNHEAVFQYQRVPDPAKPNEIQVTLQYPVATLLRFEPDRAPVMISFQLASDLRHESSSVIKRTTEAYNSMAVVSAPQLPKLVYLERPFATLKSETLNDE
ncbi:MAG: hypothetical protein ACSLFQ_20100 [Thermoanaerobaculia bacterium]